jgi:hypothetical protein
MHDVVDYDTFKDRVSDATRATHPMTDAEIPMVIAPASCAVVPVQLRPETLDCRHGADTGPTAGVCRPPASTGRPQYPASGCVWPLLPPVHPSALLLTRGCVDYDGGFIGGVA